MKLFGRKKQQATGSQPLLSPVAGADTLVAAGAGGKTDRSLFSRAKHAAKSMFSSVTGTETGNALDAIRGELNKVAAGTTPSLVQTRSITAVFNREINKLRIKDIMALFGAMQTKGEYHGLFQAQHSIFGQQFTAGKTPLYYHIIRGLQARAMERFSQKHFDSRTGTYKLGHPSTGGTGKAFQVLPITTLSRFADLMIISPNQFLCCFPASTAAQQEFRAHSTEARKLTWANFGIKQDELMPMRT